MKRLSLSGLAMAVAISLLTSLTFAAENKKILVISDIDDTIKASHILSNLGKTARVGNMTIPFRGMAELYQLILEENPDQTKIVYLSNAPETVAGIPALQFAHQTFLSLNGFPPGELELRESIFEKNHKIKTIRRLLTNEKPDIVIMIGDNGERDAEIYRQATVEFQNPNIQMISFIHQVYSTKKGVMDRILGTDAFSEVGKNLQEDQIGHVTPVEISLELGRQRLLSSDRVRKMVETVAPLIVEESVFDIDTLGAVTFPSFKTCDRYVWLWQKTTELLPLIRKINNKCR